MSNLWETVLSFSFHVSCWFSFHPEIVLGYVVFPACGASVLCHSKTWTAWRRPEGVVFLRQFVWTRSWERRRQKEGSFLEGDRMRAAIHAFSPEAPELQVAKSALCLRFGHWSFLNPVNVNSCQIRCWISQNSSWSSSRVPTVVSWCSAVFCHVATGTSCKGSPTAKTTRDSCRRGW